jgi:chromosomal replication initiator protein
MDKKAFWEKVLLALSPKAGKAHLLTFFKDTVVANHVDGVLTVGVSGIVSRDNIRHRYHMKLLEIVKSLDPGITAIEYEVISTLLTDDNHPDKVDLKNIVTDETPKIRKVPNKQEVMVDGMRSKMMKYTLDSYIPGGDNRLVHAACLAVAAKPGNIYNPLYVYGGVGLGKTHLLQATGNQMQKNHPNLRVVYLTAENFINEIIEAIGKRHTKPFKDKYRNVDCLIVDDIQFFANKATSEQEFFHTFNELYDAGKQIIMSADRPPRDLDGLDDRLRSRFAMGMVIEVCVPDFETRVAILQQKCREHGELIDPEILSFIANNVTTSVREMIGVLVNIIAQAQLENANPTMNSVARVLQKLNRAQRVIGDAAAGTMGGVPSQPGMNGAPGLNGLSSQSAGRQTAKTLDDVIDAVSSYYKIDRTILTGLERRREVIIPRQICMYLIRELLNQSYETIGENFGGKNHTTVLHSCNKIMAQIKEDQRLMRDVNALKREMGF